MDSETERSLAAFQREVGNCSEVDDIRLAAVTLYRRMIRADLPEDPMAASLRIVELFVRDLGRSRQKALSDVDG